MDSISMHLYFKFMCILIAIGSGTSKKPARENLAINSCSPVRLIFNGSARSIEVNRHCGSNTKVYKLSGAGSVSINGLYESYGTKFGVPKFEKALHNGTIYRLQRDSGGWIIMRSDLTILYKAKSNKSNPPTKGWKSIHGEEPPPKITRYNFSETAPEERYLDENRMKSFLLVDESGNPVQKSTDSGSTTLATMLHPLVGPSLGSALHATYISASPVPSIVLDGLFNEQLLKKALVFEDIPLSDWVGPETALGCCANKYRLNFNDWRSNKWARGLQALIHDANFISFLEMLTGIRNLVPVKVEDNRFVELGSSLIAVQRNGYLDIHNDFNTFNTHLNRRINVLLYLNRHWKEDWQGHLEMWNANLTRCVQRIPPLFNRMAVFTVTDDAFHGHPEPLQCPDDTARYALQLVYYTVAHGPLYSDSPGPKRVYNGSHSAIFQPLCAGMPALKDFCARCLRDYPYGDRRCCECNYDR